MDGAITFLVGVLIICYMFKIGFGWVSLAWLVAVYTALTGDAAPQIVWVALVIWTIVKVVKRIQEASARKAQEEEHLRRVSVIHSDMSGIEFEEYVARRLATYGYYNIQITRGSGDFGADVIATDEDGITYSIQCKLYRTGKCGVKAVQEAISGMSYYGCTGSMVVTTSTFTPAAVKLAQTSGTILWENFN